MNSIITLPKLVDLLSKATSTEPAKAEKFVLDFTNLITEALATDSTVKIKGFGTFTRTESYGKTVVRFDPEKEMNDHINSPFSCFEPVPLSDGVSADMLDEAVKKQDDNADFGDDDDAPEESTSTDDTHGDDELLPPLMEEVEDTPDDATPAEEPLPPLMEEAPEEDVKDAGHGSIDRISNYTPRYSTSEETPRDDDAPKKPTTPHFVYADDEEPASSPNPWFWLSMSFILGLLIGFGVGYFCHDPIAARTYDDAVERLGGTPAVEADSLDITSSDATTPDEAEAGQAEATDDAATGTKTTETETKAETNVPSTQPAAQEKPSIADAQKPEAKPEPKPDGNKSDASVYDTVSANYTLMSMAGKHYGKKCYWVYIYEENKNKISNPNNVREGLKLIIPPREKYDVSTVESENEAAAKRKGAEILSKFK